ncbi:MAG: c-type cytochrome [Pseudomonadota bacterium]
MAANDLDDADELVQRIGSGNVIAGKAKSATELCQGCHGERGDSNRGEYPKLNGQYADYILRQFNHFKSGERKHQLMNNVASNVSDADVADIAAYFASNETMKGNAAVDTQNAKSLFLRGDMKRDILPCASCHGQAGKGTFSGSESYPAIGGQHKTYLREQLRNWRSGVRGGSGNAMNIITRSLSDAEIEALSTYISGL